MSDHCPDVSVVVPVRNGANYLPGFLDALAAQTLPAEHFETIVVDDGSKDATAPLLERWAALDPSRRRLVRSAPAGPAAARNLGVAHARGEWIVFTDSDVLPDPGWLVAFRDAGTDDSVEALEGAIEVAGGTGATAFGHVVVNTSGGLYMTANMAYRRALLERVGGFDERFTDAFLEDSDLAFRVLDAGIPIPFVPGARVLHPVLQHSPWGILRLARRTRWLKPFAAKHPARFEEDLRARLRPLSRVDADVLLALAAAAALPRTRGPARLLAVAAVANALRHVRAEGRLDVPSREKPARLLLTFALPLAKLLWLAEGEIRARSSRWKS